MPITSLPTPSVDNPSLTNNMSVVIPNKEGALRTLTQRKVKIEAEMERLGRQYGRGITPEHILDKLMLEQKALLEHVEEDISSTKNTMHMHLTDERIAWLVAFSEDFSQRLATVEQSFEQRRNVIEGLDVQVLVLWHKGQLSLKLTSLLRSEGTVLTVDTISSSARRPDRARAGS